MTININSFIYFTHITPDTRNINDNITYTVTQTTFYAIQRVCYSVTFVLYNQQDTLRALV